MLLEMDIAARQPPALTAPIASTVPVVSPVLTAPTASTVPMASLVITAPIAPIAPKQLLLDRPEVLIQAYLAEKIAWLAQYPTARLTEYYKTRKWKNLQLKVLKEQLFYILKEQRDLNSNIITIKANQTNKEIVIQLDNEERKEEEEYNRL